MSDFPCACEWSADDNRLLALCGAHQEREDALRAEVERLTKENAALRARLVERDDEIMALHQIGSMDDLRAIAAECEKRDYCSCAPCEMSYCVTRRFVAALQTKLDAAGPAGGAT